MPEIILVTHVATEADLDTSLIGDLVILDPGGGADPVLVSTTLHDGGIGTWETADGNLEQIDATAYSGEAGWAGCRFWPRSRRRRAPPFWQRAGRAGP